MTKLATRPTTGARRRPARDERSGPGLPLAERRASQARPEQSAEDMNAALHLIIEAYEARTPRRPWLGRRLGKRLGLRLLAWGARPVASPEDERLTNQQHLDNQARERGYERRYLMERPW